MPVFRPARITGFDDSALHVINQLFREIEGSFQDLQKRTPSRSLLGNTSTLVFGTVGANSTSEATMHVPGASTTGTCHCSPAQGINLPAGLTWSCLVTAQDQVTVRLANATTGGIAVNTQKWNVSVIQ